MNVVKKLRKGSIEYGKGVLTAGIVTGVAASAMSGLPSDQKDNLMSGMNTMAGFYPTIGNAYFGGLAIQAAQGLSKKKKKGGWL